MTTISLRIPDSTHGRLKSWAAQDHVSINQFISTAVAEKLAAIETVKAIHERGLRGSRSKFVQALAQVPAAAVSAADQVK